MKLKWMRFGFLTISSPDGKRSPPESFAFVVFYSLFDDLNMGVQLSSLKVTGQSIFWYYFHYPLRQGCPGDPRPSPPMAPQTLHQTDTKNGERSHSANLYNHSKFAIFNDRSQLLDSIITLWSSSFWEQPGWSIITTEEIALFPECENRFECPPGLCMYGLSQL